MNLSSHATITNRLCKKYFPINKRFLIVLGSLVPDINPLTQPHREGNLLKRILKNHKAIEKSRFQLIKSFRLGILFHYICDYFCYAHNYNLDISHGTRHIKYEIELHKLLKASFGNPLNSAISRDDFVVFIKKCKEAYDKEPSYISRDVEYCLAILENTLQSNLQNFKLKKGHI